MNEIRLDFMCTKCGRALDVNLGPANPNFNTVRVEPCKCLNIEGSEIRDRMMAKALNSWELVYAVLPAPNQDDRATIMIYRLEMIDEAIEITRAHNGTLIFGTIDLRRVLRILNNTMNPFVWRKNNS